MPFLLFCFHMIHSKIRGTGVKLYSYLMSASGLRLVIFHWRKVFTKKGSGKDRAEDAGPSCSREQGSACWDPDESPKSEQDSLPRSPTPKHLRNREGLVGNSLRHSTARGAPSHPTGDRVG